MKPRIHFVTDWYLPSSLATSVRFQPLIQELFETNNFSICIYTDKLSKGEEFVKPNFFASPSNSHNFLRRLFQEFLLGIELFFKLILITSDLVIITSPPFFSSYFAVLGCTISRKKYIFDVRDVYPDVYSKARILSENGFVFQILEKCEKYIYCHAVKVFTVTPKLKSLINAKSGMENCELLINGYSEKKFILNPEKFDSFTVVFHGNLGRFQNPALILEIAAILKKKKMDIQFIVIGDGPQQDLLKYHTLGNLTYKGRLDNFTVAEIISKCHLGVSFRSDDEISKNSMPVKIYEYIGVGIPILVTPKSEGGQLVEDNGFGRQFSNIQVDEIVNEIIKLKCNPEYYKQYQNNIILNRPDYSREKLAKYFASFLEITLINK